MPIRPEHRQFYGASWRRFRLQLIETAGTVCRHCGTDYGPRINAAHREHDPRDSQQVILLCPGCHARHDAPHRIAIMRRRKATATGQLWLLPELEWAPMAFWEIPGWIFDRIAQLDLFTPPAPAAPPPVRRASSG
jgi:hypothetical protein